MDTTHYEVRCERCKTSFAPGTKQCVHCGGPLGRRLLQFDTLSGARARPPSAADMPSPTADAQPDIGRFLRIALIALAVLAAIARRFFSE